jgi:hypothetical protein
VCSKNSFKNYTKANFTKHIMRYIQHKSLQISDFTRGVCLKWRCENRPGWKHGFTKKKIVLKDNYETYGYWSEIEANVL